MAGKVARSILQRQLDARAKLWPDLTEPMLWSMNNEGWVAVPRLMPLMLSIMDDMAGKGFPVSRVYLELWSRMRVEESFVALNRPEEMALHAGFDGQRAVRTWKDRVQRLVQLGFIGAQTGPMGDLSFAVIYNPYHVIKRAYLKKLVAENKWQSLMIRANDINIFDLDDVDNQGQLVISAPEGDESEAKKAEPAKVSVRRRSGGSRKRYSGAR